MPKPNNALQVNILRPCYAMASTDGQTADITMYGEIVETQPIDWWTDEPIPGQYIIESEFLSDLQQVENCPQIIIRMDSLGGDAGVSILIHNRLRELAAKGTKLTCIVTLPFLVQILTLHLMIPVPMPPVQRMSPARLWKNAPSSSGSRSASWALRCWNVPRMK